MGPQEKRSKPRRVGKYFGIKYGFEAWMGLEYSGRAKRHNDGTGIFPDWWADGRNCQLNQLREKRRVVATTESGDAVILPKRSVGIVSRHVREDSTWCWKLRFMSGLEIIDPSSAVLRRFTPIDTEY